MSIVGRDDRFIVIDSDLSTDPFDSVVAIDTGLLNRDSATFANGGGGTGIIIGPNHVLTAAHVLSGRQRIKITQSQDVPNFFV